MHLNSSQGAREDAFSPVTTSIDSQLKVNLLLTDTVAPYLLQVLASILSLQYQNYPSVNQALSEIVYLQIGF